MGSSPTKVPPAEASGDPSPVQEKTVAKITSSPEGAAGYGISGNRIQKKSPKELKRARTAEDIHILDATKEGNVGRFINVRGRKQTKMSFFLFFCPKMKSGGLGNMCVTFLIVSKTYSTAAIQTSSSKTSSQTPMTQPSRSSPSSPKGEEEVDEAGCVSAAQPGFFSECFFFLSSPQCCEGRYGADLEVLR